MDYKKYLLEQPSVGYPRDIVEVVKEDGSNKIFYVNNQLIDPIRGDETNSPLHNAIRKYLKDHEKTDYAQLYRERNADEKVLKHTIKLND